MRPNGRRSIQFLIEKIRDYPALAGDVSQSFKWEECRRPDISVRPLLGIEGSYRDHQYQKEQRNDDGRHDPLGQANLPQGIAPALLRRERVALGHR